MKRHLIRYAATATLCDDCASRQRQITRRNVALPRAFTFNRTVGLDYFFVAFRERALAVLNAVDHGTNFQVCALYGECYGPPESARTWALFAQTWLRFLGPPEMIVTDGGSEFNDRFERGVEQFGIFQHVTDGESPWQNAKPERHGGWAKQRLERELSPGATVVDADEALGLLISELLG